MPEYLQKVRRLGMLLVFCQCIISGLQSSAALRLLQHKCKVRCLRIQILLGLPLRQTGLHSGCSP